MILYFLLSHDCLGFTEKLDYSIHDAASPRSDDDMFLSFSPPPSPAVRRNTHKTPIKQHRPPPASGAETGKEDEITSAVALDHKEKVWFNGVNL